MGCGASAKGDKYKADGAADGAKGGDASGTKPVADTTTAPAPTATPEKTAAAPPAEDKPIAAKGAPAAAIVLEATKAAPADLATAAPKEEPAKEVAAAPKEEPPKEATEAAPAAEEDDEEDDEDEMDEKEAEEMFRRGSMVMHKKREGVMAETTAMEEGWEPPKIEKTDEQKERIKTAISRPAAFMFHALEPAEVETLIMAFQEHDLEPGAEVIKQGARVTPDEPGLFVIESGELDVFKSADPEADKGPNVFTYQGQGQFGELALLYNAPRAATIIAKTASVCWSIDRNTFNHCVKDATIHRAQKYEEFLASVEVLQALAPDERSKIADVLKSKVCNEGDAIITQSETGDDFYIIEVGSAVATKDGEVVKEYGPKDYFGELSLISSQERRATVTAKETPTKVLSLDRSAFTRLLGSLEEKLKEKAKEYKGMEGGL